MKLDTLLRQFLASSVVFLAAAVHVVPAHAETTRATFTVSITILPSCTATASSEAAPAPAIGNSDATSRVAVTCNGNTPYSVRTLPLEANAPPVEIGRLLAAGAGQSARADAPDNSEKAQEGRTAGELQTIYIYY